MKGRDYRRPRPPLRASRVLTTHISSLFAVSAFHSVCATQSAFVCDLQLLRSLRFGHAGSSSSSFQSFLCLGSTSGSAIPASGRTPSRKSPCFCLPAFLVHRPRSNGLTQLRLTVVLFIDREWRAQLREAAESRAKIAAALGVNGEHTDVVQPFSPWPPQEPLTEDGGGHGNDAALPTSALATSSAAGALPIWQRRLSVSTARRRSIESSARRPPRTRAMLLHLPSASSYHYWSSELGSGSTRDRLEWPRNIEV